jgi:hypothetical protein
MLLESTAQAGNADALPPLVSALRGEWPADASFWAALSAFRHEAYDDATAHLLDGFKSTRQQVWVRLSSMQTALSLVPPLVAANRDLAPSFMELLRHPFPGGLADPARLNTLVEIIPLLTAEHQLEVLALFEPNPPWQREFLEFRLKTYRAASHPRTQQAERDVEEFLRHAGRRLDDPVADGR